MAYGALILAATIACVTAKYTVPVPLHYDIEKAFQAKVSGIKWDPTNYLTYLAAMYSLCAHYAEGMTAADGRIVNQTAYTTLLKYFDSSLLPNNLVVYKWDGESASGENQDAGSLDRDIRTLFNARATAGGQPIANVAAFNPSDVRGYDRFGCSVDIKCQPPGVVDKRGFMIVCIFGTSVTPRSVSGEGGSPTPRPTPPPPQPQPQPTPPPRPTPAPRTPAPPRPAATTRPRPPAVTTITGGFYETFREHSAEYYDSIVNNIFQSAEFSNYRSDAVVADERRLVTFNLCTVEGKTTEFTKEKLIAAGFPQDVDVVLYSQAVSPLPTQSDMTTLPLTQSTKSVLQSIIGGERVVAPARDDVSDLACAWAVCTQNVMVGCAAWGTVEYSPEDVAEQNWKKH